LRIRQQMQSCMQKPTREGVHCVDADTTVPPPPTDQSSSKQPSPTPAPTSSHASSFPLPQCDARFLGERHLTTATGALTHLSYPLLHPSLEMGGAGHAFLALCHGLASNLHDMIRCTLHQPTTPQHASSAAAVMSTSTSSCTCISSILCQGGALVRNPLLRLCLADAFNIHPDQVRIAQRDSDPTAPSSSDGDAARGAAMMAILWKDRFEKRWKKVSV